MRERFLAVGRALSLEVRLLASDGREPVGRGIGPALEARDALAVLRNDAAAPQDLRERALVLAAAVLEVSGRFAPGTGHARALQALEDGSAWGKFDAICRAQGGRRELPVAPFRRAIEARAAGTVRSIDNRRVARLAKLAGAPRATAAGLDLHARLGDAVARGQPLFTLCSASAGEFSYALDYLADHPDIMEITP